ncbi:MAG TPA: FUSC family membrane protein, partial [Rhodopila sp.]
MRPEWMAVRRALRPVPNPLAVLPAVRTVLAVGACAALGAATGNLIALGLMYFGAACSAVFATAGIYRTRLLFLVSQGLGAAIGLAIGTMTTALVGKIAISAAVALICGMVGAIGPACTAGAVMTVVGLAYAQFSGLAMPWWQQAGWYLLGTVIVAVPALLPGLVEGQRHQRRVVADVFAAAADLLQSVGTADDHRLRVALAARSVAARAAVWENRLMVPRR